MKKTFLGITVALSSALLFSAPALYAGIITKKANLVLGQPNFTSNSSALLSEPYGIAVDTTSDRVYVSDTLHDKVFWWDNITQLTNGQQPSGSIGKTALPPDEYSLSVPKHIHCDQYQILWVADSDNHRVIMYKPPLLNGASGYYLLGQTLWTTRVRGCSGFYINGPSDFVVDYANSMTFMMDTTNSRGITHNRTLGAKDYPPKNARTSPIFGQPDLNTNTPNNGNTKGIGYPQGACLDASGNLFIADTGGNRVLYFTRASFSIWDYAEAWIGQPLSYVRSPDCTQNKMDGPTKPFIDADGDLWVADTGNNRILKFVPPFASGMDASEVFGQPDYDTPNSGLSQTEFNTPTDVLFDHHGYMWVVDSLNNRVLRFDPLAINSFTPDSVEQGAEKYLVVQGQGIPSTGMTVTLSKTGETDIQGTITSVSNENEMTVKFDIASAATGTWDVTVLGYGTTQQFANALEVYAAGTGPSYKFSISSVTPDSGQIGKTVNLAISGSGFLNGSQVKLTKTGKSDIPSSKNTYSAAQIVSTFDLSDASRGYWNVSVSSKGYTAILSNGFLVTTTSSTAKEVNIYMENTISFVTDIIDARLLLPVGTFTENVTLTVSEPPSIPEMNQREFIPTNLVLMITPSKDIQPRAAFRLTMIYNDADVPGLDKSKLVICYYDPAKLKWLQVPSTSYPSENKVVGEVSHISIFRMAQRVPEATLENAYVYPNPYKPGSGTQFENSSLGEGVVFAGLCSGAKIRIYTISGDFVKELVDEDGDGFCLWDTKNKNGQDAASGVYVYVITNTERTSDKTKGRFTIIK
ncbi:MAG: NHL repeat-containing protein [Endomicrobiales bacterium]|nr:NHL repeat-containing protein [Endomicrobiales bacterium]